MPVYNVIFEARKSGSIGAFSRIMTAVFSESKGMATVDAFDKLHAEGYETLGCLEVLSENEVDRLAEIERGQAALIKYKAENACGCKRGEMRDNCPACEGTGVKINFAAIRSVAIAKAEGK
jgi:hypothetical protein